MKILCKKVIFATIALRVPAKSPSSKVHQAEVIVLINSHNKVDSFSILMCSNVNDFLVAG